MSVTAREIDTVDRPVLPDVVAEHLEELAFLSIQRRKLLFSSEIGQDQLAAHDERLAAHWDGLVVAGTAAVELALGRLEEPDPWEVHAAARVWLMLGNPAPDEVMARIDGADDALHPAWREALRHVPSEIATRVLPDPLLSGAPAGVQSVLLYARGWHGSLPQGPLPPLVASGDAAVRRSLARALGWQEPAYRGTGEMLRILGGDADPEVRRAACWSLALVDPTAALARCRTAVRSGSADPFDVRVLGLLGGGVDLGPLRELLASDALRLSAAHALGDLGQSAAIPALREMLRDQEETVVEAAREALRVLAGSDADEVLDAVAAGQRMLRGVPFPWSGEPEAETMESKWRRSIAEPDPATAWLRREVPDGFFTAAPEQMAVPGE